jgi:hypothetical protein
VARIARRQTANLHYGSANLSDNSNLIMNRRNLLRCLIAAPVMLLCGSAKPKQMVKPEFRYFIGWYEGRLAPMRCVNKEHILEYFRQKYKIAYEISEEAYYIDSGLREQAV